MKKILVLLLCLTILQFDSKDNSGNSIGNDITIRAQNPSPQQNKMKGFKSNIEKDALENNNFRKVVYTAKHIQVVLMSLKAGEDIGEEIHPDTDQFFRFESGSGKCFINGNEYSVKSGDAIVIPAGAKHNIINTDSKQELKIYTIYSPPQHKDGIARATKKDAEQNEAKFDGKTTE